MFSCNSGDNSNKIQTQEIDVNRSQAQQRARAVDSSFCQTALEYAKVCMLVVTIRGIITPRAGELNNSFGHVPLLL